MNHCLKLFISYSHSDRDYFDQFTKHIAPLENNGLILQSSDRDILPGETFQSKINNSLAESNIICLLVSSNFLSSNACLMEKLEAVELRKKRGVYIVPIILSACGWKDDSDISPLLVLPTDGAPISSFDNLNTAWHDVYEGLKRIIEEERTIQQLNISYEFGQFLQCAGLLTNAHSRADKVSLNQIYVHPELTMFDYLGNKKVKLSASKIVDELLDHSKLLVAGEAQSGKTSFCKILFSELMEKNFVPLYLSDDENGYGGKVENLLSKAFDKQYAAEIDFENVDKERVVIVLDDFHYAKNKEKIINNLTNYPYQIFIVDDIFQLNIKDESIMKSFQRFRIEEYAPISRNYLIRKWVELADTSSNDPQNANIIYQNIDKTTELVNAALGKNIGAGIMPSYPFFILSVINTSEAFLTPLDQEITSQGYCYQALIYIYLRKQSVSNDDIDTYINFLTELAFHFYKQQKQYLSDAEIIIFLDSYRAKFNLPVKQEKLLSNLQKSNIFIRNSTNNYSFGYLYVYYFFVAKYLADNLEHKKTDISRILNNLDKQENAYIAVFLSHHSKNISILDETLEVASNIFKEYDPATLTRQELAFFDKKSEVIVKAVMPHFNSTPEMHRNKELMEQTKIEQTEIDDDDQTDRNPNDFSRKLRKSVKTVEVMGTIIKNRAGSLEKNQLQRVFEEGAKVHFRILQFIIEFLKDEEFEQTIIDYISNRFIQIGENLDDKKANKIAKQIFWNINFYFVYYIINKTVHSLGSDKLTETIEKFYHGDQTPAAYLVKCGSLMWYSKYLQIDNMKNRLREADFSITAENILNHMIVNHCRFHQIDYKERQRIESLLGISKEKLLN